MDHTDVFADFSWNDPALALNEPWLHSWLMRGGDQIQSMDVGDLVFPTRTSSAAHRRRLASSPDRSRRVVGRRRCDRANERKRERPEFHRDMLPPAPLRLPRAGQRNPSIDQAFDIAAFRDRSRKALLELDVPDALAIVRACGLPAEVLTEPDPDQLAPLIAGLDLGPPTVVRKRILDGVRASAHKRSVESAARAVAVRGLRQTGQQWSPQKANAESAQICGHVASIRAAPMTFASRSRDSPGPTRGRHGSRPPNATQPSRTLDEAVVASNPSHPGALRTDAKSHWLRSDEAANVFDGR